MGLVQIFDKMYSMITAVIIVAYKHASKKM